MYITFFYIIYLNITTNILNQFYEKMQSWIINNLALGTFEANYQLSLKIIPQKLPMNSRNFEFSDKLKTLVIF